MDRGCSPASKRPTASRIRRELLPLNHLMAEKGFARERFKHANRRGRLTVVVPAAPASSRWKKREKMGPGGIIGERNGVRFTYR
jgi:hypothetical protein